MDDAREKGYAPKAPPGESRVEDLDPGFTLSEGKDKPEPDLTHPAGSTIGRYVVLEPLGQGGMGQVYKAYDPKLDRRVALKVLRIKQRSREEEDRARERLVREAQALAQLAHPNVVAVYDVGAVGDDMFVTMELIEGRTLRQWLQEDKPALRQIVDAMAAAGRGIAAAHKAGLVHRDIKPGNIIVGNDGRVRVLDFGLARSTSVSEVSDSQVRGDSRESTSGDSSSSRTDSEVSPESIPSDKILRASLTLEGQIMGTPGYMAPEQYLGSSLTELSDQFSFCVTFYEALYRKRPFTAKNYKALRYRVVTGRLNAPPADVKIPKWLRQILLKGLMVKEKNRFPSMDALLAELAKDPWLLWRRVSVVTAVLLLLLLGFGVSALLQARRQSSCEGSEQLLTGIWDREAEAKIGRAFLATNRLYARDTLERVTKTLNEYTAAWVRARREACGATYQKGTQTEQLLGLRMVCLQRKLSKLKALVEVFGEKPDVDVVDNAVKSVANLGNLTSCADEEALLAEIKPPEDEQVRARVKELEQKLERVEALRNSGKYSEGLALAAAAEQESHQIGYRPIEAQALCWLADLQDRGGAYAQAEETLRLAIRTAAEARDFATLSKAWLPMLWVVGYRRSHPDEALALVLAAEVALDLANRPPDLYGRLLATLATIYDTKGNYEQAQAHYTKAIEILGKALGPEHPTTVACLGNLGLVYLEQGDYPKALERLQAALQIRERILGPEHPELAGNLNNLGLVFIMLGDYDRALEDFQKSLQIKERQLGPEHPDLATSLDNLGMISYYRGDYAKAVAYLERTLKIQQKALEPSHPAISASLDNLGFVFLEQGALQKAQDTFRRSLDLTERRKEQTSEGAVKARAGLGMLQLAAGHADQAIAQFEQVLALCGTDRCRGEKEPLTRALAGLAMALGGKGPRAQGHAKAALELLRDQRSVQAKALRSQLEALLAGAGRTR